MLECLDWRQLEQLVKTTFKRCAGAGPCGCFAVRASRSPNLIAHPLATFATRKLLTTFVGGPDRYAAGASRDRRISTPAFFLCCYNCLSAIEKEGTGGLEEGKGKSPYFIQTFEHSNIQTFEHFLTPNSLTPNSLTSRAVAFVILLSRLDKRTLIMI